MAASDKGKPSLDDLFKSKAKKKPKSVNLNDAASADRPVVPLGPATSVKPRDGGVAKADGLSAATLEGWERALRRDQELLKSCGLWIQEVEADGACLFRAFADQLQGGGGSTHAGLRERCVDFMEAHRADFEPFLDEEFEGYCARMRESSTWGGHVEVQALARCNGVNAIIYQPAEARRPEGLLETAVEILTTDAEDVRCVQLSFHPTHHAGQHYNSVRLDVDDGAGPAPPFSLAELRRRIREAYEAKPAPAATTAAAEAPAAVSSAKPKAKVFF